MQNKITVNVVSEHPCYADHFPGAPVVPGALMLQWIIEAVESKHPLIITAVKNVKFVEAVLPGDSCELTIKTASEPTSLDNKIKFDCFRGQQMLLKGVLECTPKGEV